MKKFSYLILLLAICINLTACKGTLLGVWVVADTVEESSDSESVVSISESDAASTVQPSVEESVQETEPRSGVLDMEIHFIDVGQGDATLVKADGHYMLIDAGDDSKGVTVQYYLQKQGVDKLDYLVLTHTDADHIGGADVIITKFDIEKVFIGDFEKDSNAYEDLKEALEYKRLSYSTPEVGAEYQLGNATFTILAPNRTYSDSDNSSIALLLENGENRFLFSGDSGAEAEEDILKNGISIGCDVYKAGHHGSKTSSTQAFVDAMSPTYCVISCMEGNSYGHPHAEVLNRLRNSKVSVFRTDEQGSVIAYSDGERITWNCASSESWKAGEGTQSASRESNMSGGESTGEAEPSQPSSQAPSEESSTPAQETSTAAYAVNGKNGKVHRVGACPATGTGNQAMKLPIYFNTFEEAEAHSVSIAPELEKRKCGNCWK